jgi:hypothetical protein
MPGVDVRLEKASLAAQGRDICHMLVKCDMGWANSIPPLVPCFKVLYAEGHACVIAHSVVYLQEPAELGHCGAVKWNHMVSHGSCLLTTLAGLTRTRVMTCSLNNGVPPPYQNYAHSPKASLAFPGPAPTRRKKSPVSARNPALILIQVFRMAGAEDAATLGPRRSWPAQPAMGSARDHQGPLPGTVHSCLVSDSNRSSLSKATVSAVSSHAALPLMGTNRLPLPCFAQRPQVVSPSPVIRFQGGRPYHANSQYEPQVQGFGFQV